MIKTYGQKTTVFEPSLADTIKKYFNYDTLKNFSCKETPSGIYTLKFKINKQNKVYDYNFSNDSLLLLKQLFISALNLSLEKCKKLTFDKEYLQLIYYSNTFSCVYQQDTSATNLNAINKEVSKFLSDQLMAIESSINQLVINEKSQFFFLNPVVINNDNPNRPHPKKGFRNDHQRMSIDEMSDDRLQKLIEEVNRRREAKRNADNQ